MLQASLVVADITAYRNHWPQTSLVVADVTAEVTDVRLVYGEGAGLLVHTAALTVAAVGG